MNNLSLSVVSKNTLRNEISLLEKTLLSLKKQASDEENALAIKLVEGLYTEGVNHVIGTINVKDNAKVLYEEYSFIRETFILTYSNSNLLLSHFFIPFHLFFSNLSSIYSYF